MRAAIEVSNLLFEYPGVRALDDVSFDVAQGSVTALVGANGAGKTTLLRCLAGLEQPMLGRISVSGADVLEAPREVHRRIGFLSDFYGLYDALSVRQCLTYAAAAHGVPESGIEAAVSRTAERLGLTALVARRASELSRGQRQRVAIGQAMIHAPQVLMLDEPASGLDPEARHALAGLFLRLRAEGMTLLVSSHILAELDEYSTHMLVMRDGRIIESKPLGGAPADARRIRVAFAGEARGLREAVSALEGVRVLDALEGVRVLDALEGARVLDDHGAEALLEVVGDAKRCSELLRALVVAGLPVSAFAEEHENLHQSYLRTMGEAVRPGGPG